MEKGITASVSVYNPNVEVFRSFIESLVKFTPELKQLIINDNGSTDLGFEEVIKEFFNDSEVIVDILKYPTNLGFGYTHNKALECAEQPYFAVLNDDIIFYEEWASKFIDKLEEDKVAIVGPKTGVCNTLTLDCEGIYTETDDPDYIEGSCFMMKTDFAKEFGLFDEEYKFAYFEDTDLSLRLKKAGYKLGTVDINWEHLRATTSSRIEDLDIKGLHIINEKTFRKRWQSYLLCKKFAKVIVLKRIGSHGDVFLLTPIIRALKKKYKEDTVIVIMSKCFETLKNNPYIDGFALYEAPIDCDEIIDFDFSYEKDFRKHIVKAYEEVAGVKADSLVGEIYQSKKDLDYVNNLLKHFPKKYITIDLSSSNWGGKQWPTKYYKKLVDLLNKDGYTTIGVGTNNNFTGYVNVSATFVNSLSIHQTAIVLSNSLLHIGNEGLLIHLCQSMNKHALCLYGCTTPKYVNDTSKPTLHQILTPAICRGCRHTFSAGTTILCKRDYECMKLISVEMVYEKAREILKSLGE